LRYINLLLNISDPDEKMQRRKFIDSITSLVGGLLILPGKLLSSALVPQDFYKSDLQLKNLAENGKQTPLRWIKLFSQVYISINDLAEGLNAGTFTNTSKRKTVIYLAKDKVVFTADNGFIALNDQLYQFLFEPVWQNGEMWAPATLTADLISGYTALKLDFNEQAMEMTLGQKDVNIGSIRISAKENGVLLQILTAQAFDKRDVTMRLTNGWLYVEIFGGKGDAKALARTGRSGIVSDIEVIQFEKVLTLAFKLNKEIISRDLILNPETNDILVNLRTETVATSNDKEVNEELEEQKNEWLIDTIVIDAGHGGKDSGAVGYGGLMEKDIVLPVALKLGAIIKEKLPGVKVAFTRTSDIFIPLWRRPQYANEQKGKLFISLHCNSNLSASASGFETYFLSADNDARARDVVLKENGVIGFEGLEDQKRYEGVNFILATMAQNAFIKQSQYLASVVQKAMTSQLNSLGMESRGVKQAGFLVMVGATMPNILVEMGFVSNKFEAKLLRQKSTQTMLAHAIFNGIAKYKNDIENAI
jgi:N-acetylmuramoyl-L-alanine amidase